MPGGVTFLASLNADIPTPAAGKATVFFSLDSGVPSYKNSSGTVLPLGTNGATGATGPMGPAIPLLESNNEIEPMMIPGPIGLSGITAGSWTPVIGGSGGTSGQSYTAQDGKYIRIPLTIGALILFTFRANLSVKGTITTNVQIENLPFTSSASLAIGTIPMNWTNLAAAKILVQGLVLLSTTVISVRCTTAADVSLVTTMVTADIANNSTLAGTGMYFTD